MSRFIVITETTVGSVDGLSVGMGNVWERDVAFPGEPTRRVMSCMLYPEEGERRVAAVGLKVRIGDAEYEVTEVEPGENGELGWVKLTLP